MNKEALSKVISGFKNLRVMIIGDVMIDAYIYGKVNRISPEAPIPVVSVTEKEIRLGGAANVAKNITSLGAVPVLCSVVGNDPYGSDFKQLLNGQSMSSDGIIHSDNRITTRKNRVISGAQHIVRFDEEVESPLESQDQKIFIDRILSLLPTCDVVIFEDYDKGCLDPLIISTVIQKAKALGKPVAIDPKKKNFLSYEGVTLFKPNLREFKEGLLQEIDTSDTERLYEAVSNLQSKINFENTLITLSDKGVLYYSKEEKGIIPAHLRNIADVSGAGDTVISVAALCMAMGLSLSETAWLANLGGGIVCESPGVVPINLERLLRESELVHPKLTI